MTHAILLAIAIVFAALSFTFNPEGNEISFAPAVNEVVTAQGANFLLPVNLAHAVLCRTFYPRIENTEGKCDVPKSNAKKHIFSAFAVHTNAAKLTAQSKGFFSTMTLVAKKYLPRRNNEIHAMSANSDGMSAMFSGMYDNFNALTHRIKKPASGIDILNG